MNPSVQGQDTIDPLELAAGGQRTGDLPRPAPETEHRPLGFRSTLNSRPSSNPTYTNPYSAAYTPLPASAPLEPSSQEALGPADGSGPNCRQEGGLPAQRAKVTQAGLRLTDRVPGKEEPPKTTLRSPHPPAARRPPSPVPGTPAARAGPAPPRPRPAATWLTRCARHGSQLSRWRGVWPELGHRGHDSRIQVERDGLRALPLPKGGARAPSAARESSREKGTAILTGVGRDWAGVREWTREEESANSQTWLATALDSSFTTHRRGARPSDWGDRTRAYSAPALSDTAERRNERLGSRNTGARDWDCAPGTPVCSGHATQGTLRLAGSGILSPRKCLRAFWGVGRNYLRHLQGFPDSAWRD